MLILVIGRLINRVGVRISKYGDRSFDFQKLVMHVGELVNE